MDYVIIGVLIALGIWIAPIILWGLGIVSVWVLSLLIGTISIIFDKNEEVK